MARRRKMKRPYLVKVGSGVSVIARVRRTTRTAAKNAARSFSKKGAGRWACVSKKNVTIVCYANGRIDPNPYR